MVPVLPLGFGGLEFGYTGLCLVLPYLRVLEAVIASVESLAIYPPCG